MQYSIHNAGAGNIIKAMSRRRSQAQAAQGRGRFLPSLHIMPRSVVSAAEQSVSGIRPGALRNLDVPAPVAVLTGAIIFALVCFIYLTQVTAVTNANYTLQSLQSTHTDLLRERQDLLLEIGQAQSLSNIAVIAKSRLQMVPIGDQYTYINVSDGPLGAMPPLPTPSLPSDAATTEP